MGKEQGVDVMHWMSECQEARSKEMEALQLVSTFDDKVNYIFLMRHASTYMQGCSQLKSSKKQVERLQEEVLEQLFSVFVLMESYSTQQYNIYDCSLRKIREKFLA